jgi:raffinose/stachyose/melibiose transport system substrate-binding protein
MLNRRQFIAASSAISAAALLSARGYAQDKKPVVWWTGFADPEQKAVFDNDIINPFNAANPGHLLSVDYRGSELDTQTRAALLSGSGPDIVETSAPAAVTPLVEAERLLDLTPYADQLGWNSRIIPLFLNLGRYSGKLYSLPRTYETTGLFYNATLMEQRGWKVPTDIASLEALGDEMVASGIIPLIAGNANVRGISGHYPTIAMNAIAGPANIYKALSGEMPFTAKPFLDSIEALKRWWDKGYFGKDYFSITDEQAVAAMSQGKAAMMPTGTWHFQNIATYFGENGQEPGFAGFPSAPDVGAPVFPLGVGSTLSISQNSANPDGAAGVLDFIFTPEAYGNLNSDWQGEWNIPLSDLSGVVMKPGVLPLFTRSMANLAEAVAKGEYGYTSWAFFPPETGDYTIEIEEVWLGRQTPEQFLEQMQSTFEREKADGLVPALPPR